jgi:hypothetical protein
LLTSAGVNVAVIVAFPASPIVKVEPEMLTINELEDE